MLIERGVGSYRNPIIAAEAYCLEVYPSFKYVWGIPSALFELRDD